MMHPFHSNFYSCGAWSRGMGHSCEGIERMGKKFVKIWLTEEARKRLQTKKEKTGLSVSDIILKDIEPPRDIWKDKLHEHFKNLKKDFPDKIGILEYMRLIIFNSMQLSGELMREYDKEVELKLKELSNYGLELKKEEEKGEKEVRIRMDSGINFEDYTYVEQLEESMPGFCEQCGKHTDIDFRAESGDKVVFLCYACGVKVKEWLEENGGVTENR